MAPDYSNIEDLSWSNNSITMQKSGFFLLSLGVWNQGTNIIFELTINNTKVSRLLGETISAGSSGLRTLYSTLFFPVAAGDIITYSVNITGGDVTPYYIPYK